MSTLLHEVAGNACNLSPEERAELAHTLILSLDDSVDKDHESAWDSEIERRVREIKSGAIRGRPAEDILAEITARYS